MHTRTIFILLAVLLFNCVSALSQISEQRQWQLDSCVSVMPKPMCRNLDETHAYLDSIAQNDEERLWLFYGYLAIHYKYDKKRKRDHKAPIYSPEYTAQKLTGVCRDYTKVFLTLCQKSNIPCLEIYGQSPEFFPMKVIKFFTFTSSKGNHVWNTAKLNGEWKLFDPTWSRVKETRKVRAYNAATKSYKSVNIRIATRDFYMVAPEVMQRKHTPLHPAFFLQSEVPTFKSARHKEKRQKPFAENYAFQQVLDSIYAAPYPMFCKTYVRGCIQYGKLNLVYMDYAYELSLPTRKEAKYRTPTVAQYDATLKRVKEIKEYVLKEDHVNLEYQLYQFEKVFWTKREKLVKKEAEAARKRR